MLHRHSSPKLWANSLHIARTRTKGRSNLLKAYRFQFLVNHKFIVVPLSLSMLLILTCMNSFLTLQNLCLTPFRHRLQHLTRCMEHVPLNFSQLPFCSGLFSSIPLFALSFLTTPRQYTIFLRHLSVSGNAQTPPVMGPFYLNVLRTQLVKGWCLH